MSKDLIAFIVLAMVIVVVWYTFVSKTVANKHGTKQPQKKSYLTEGMRKTNMKEYIRRSDGDARIPPPPPRRRYPAPRRSN